jgi:hypothetical protein
MLTYWVIFIIPAWAALTQRKVLARVYEKNKVRGHFIWSVWWLILTLIIGLRHEVGGDWSQYLAHVEAVRGEIFIEAIFQQDIAYAFLDWFGANYWGGVYLVNTVCASIFVHGILVFCRMQSRPWLALTVAVPFLIVVVGMGYTRQSAAMGLCMLGIAAIYRRSYIRYIFLIILAALFHKSAVIFLPIILLIYKKNKISLFIGVFIICIFLFFLLLQEQANYIYKGYIEAEYKSSGAVVRVAMNVVPAIIFLFNKRSFLLTDYQLNFWQYMSFAALLCIALLVLIPSSTLIDRLALYLIPLQIFVYSHSPEILVKSWRGRRIFVVLGVVGLSASVQFVWLFFGEHASAWLPYKFYPWESIWN